MSATEIIVVLLASLAASLVKSVLGSGYPIILIPVIALFASVEDAVLIVAPANVALNCVMAYQLRECRHRSRNVWRFVRAAVVGAAGGALLLPILPDSALRLVLVAVIGLFIVNRLRQPPALSEATVGRMTPAVGGVAGLFQGATGISGPIVAPWFLSQGLDRDTFVFSITVIYGLSSVAQLVLLGSQQLYTVELLILGLALLPIAVAVAPLGARLRKGLGLVVFERLVVIVLAASAISLIVRSL